MTRSHFTQESNTAISGVLPVVQTPYHQDFTLDLETLNGEVDWLFDQGANGIVIGMVTEVNRLHDAERDLLTKTLVDRARQRGPVISSVGAESITQAIRHARSAEATGVSAHMAIPPALTRCGESEIFRYYAALIEATTKPIIVQDASGYLGNSIPIALQARLFQTFRERVMFKPEAQPIGPNLSALRDATNGEASIFEGTGGIALVDSYRRGITGTMPGSDLIWAITALWRALEAENEAAINAIQAPLIAIISQLHSLDAFLAVEKMLLVEQGVFRNTLIRGPVAFELDLETRKEILRQLQLLQHACQAPALAR